MELMSGEQQEKEHKGKKIVIISFIITMIFIVLIVVAILVLKQAENNRLKLIVDGKRSLMSNDFIITDPESGSIYLNINEIATLTNYQFFNGEYKQYSEDKTKCYVECNDELAMFELNSNIIYKNNAADKLNFDKYITDGKVKSYNNALYATQNTIQMAFNTRVTYNEDNKTIYLETLPYLVEYYKNIVTEYGYTGIAEDFITRKTLVYDMLVVQRDKKYGVVSTKDFSSIIGTKYDSMIYIENTQEFIVTSEQKTGTLDISGETNIGLRYDEVGLIDGQAGLYYVKNDNLYGVLNRKGRVIVYIEYDDIGINRNIFPLDNIKNNMFLYNNCIPLKKGTKWGIADKNGNIILNFEYDELGYAQGESLNVEGENTTIDITTKDKSINNVVVIPYIEGIVIGKGKQYGVANSIGEIIIPCEFDKIYSITNEGEDEYYLEKNGRVTKLDKYLEDNKINVNNPGGVDITTNTINNAITNTTNTTNVTNDFVIIM